VALLAGSTVGCGDDESTASPVCTPGTTVACACPGNAFGVQTCADDGSGYGSCGQCAGVGGSGGAAGGTGGAPGGTGGAPGGTGGAPGGTGGAPGGSGGIGGSTGGAGGATGGAGGEVATGGSVPFACVDLATVSPLIDFPACDVASQPQCLCEGCTDDEICFDSGLQLADDCICSDCAADRFCTDPARCIADGQCNPYYEGCHCADCADHPLCGS
jgi:hypothetical protein